MTRIHRGAVALAAVVVTTVTTLVALASTAMAQVPPPDVNTVQQQPSTATQIVHDGAPTWLLIVVALGAVALTLAGVAAAAKLHHSSRAIWVHG